MSSTNNNSTLIEDPLRFVEFVLIPGENGLHPVDEEIKAHGELHRRFILNLIQLRGGRFSLLYQLRGDITAADDIFTHNELVMDYIMSKSGDTIYAYVKMETTTDIEKILGIPSDFDLILYPPFEYPSGGGLRITVVGDFESIRHAGAVVPNPFGLKLERIGEFESTKERLFDQLTPRQQETLKIAVSEGYYQNPREATYKEIAAKLNRTDGTVGEHLRRIEKYVMAEIVP